MRSRSYSWMVIGGLLAGCVAGGDELAEEGEAAQEIEIGTDDGSDPRSNAVVLIGDICTGTLVAPNLVLTAAHCGWGDNSYATGAWITIPPVLISFGPIHGAPIATAAANAVTVPPLATAGPWLVDDIALLRLTTSVPASLAEPRPVYVDRPASLGGSSTITQIGYGGGRDRRSMTGSDYLDWLSPGDLLMNGFAYTATYHGDGIGDRGTNIEQGDGGGPMLLQGTGGPVMGVLSHWTPYGIATFGPGGEGRPSVRTWLLGHAPQKPDFFVSSITAAGCSGTSAVVRVKVENRGVRTAAAWLDVFHDLSSAPAVGTLSTIYRSTGPIAPEQSLDMLFTLPVSGGYHWIDAIVDTTRSVDELDEAQNVASRRVSFPDCTD